mgnify:CR=1 FL=1
MDPFGQGLDAEDSHGISAQGCGQPEPLIVPGAAVQTDHEVRFADALSEMIYVVGQVIAPALLAALDQDHDARMGNALGLQSLDRRQGGVGGVTIICTPPAVKLVAFK